ncbi:MAG: efflux RND transporter periplasmic adaptor subunit [Planctomycetes bacterium]|nr:efflux RND transporter periplasmic adaptor subunit [Planctomycetota bacterium]
MSQFPSPAAMIPPPNRRATRLFAVGVWTCAISGAIALIVFWLGRPQPVSVTRAVARELGSSFAGSIVQAPGWIEARPYATLVPGLVDGTITSVRAIEGDAVKAGQVLATIDARPFEEAEQQAAGAYAMARAESSQARLQHTLAEARLSVGEAAQVDVDLAAAQLARAEGSEVMARGAWERAVLDVERCSVVSPVDGVIFERRVEPGERIGGDMENEGAMFAIFDPAMVQVRCDVPLADAGSVLPGQLAEVTVDAFKGRTFHGTVLVGGFRADIAKNTLQVKIGLDDADGLLRPDTLTRVRIMVPGSNAASVRTQVVVPADWVVRDGTRATVLVMDAGVLRRIDLGEAIDTGDGWLVGGDGIRPGEVLVHPSHASLPDGTRIAPREETP